MTTGMERTRILARILYDAFEGGTREDGAQFRKLRDGSPRWMADVVRAAHGTYEGLMLPDDWVYSLAEDAAEAIAAGADADGFAHSLIDAYSPNRLAWLASHPFRLALTDEAVDELGCEGHSITDRIALGQYEEARRVFGAVYNALAARADATFENSR